LVVFIFLW